MSNESEDKVKRVLGIYTKLMNGYTVNTKDEALEYNVSERSIRRDIEDIRNFLEISESETGISNSVVSDRLKNGYRLKQNDSDKTKLSAEEILAICKILLDSRAFTKTEMSSMLERLIKWCAPKSDRKQILDLIRNEEYHYIEPQHKTIFIDTMWRIGQAIQKNQYIEIDYLKNKNKSIVKRKVKPVAIMFSEYYFYLTAFIDDKDEVRKDFDVINDSFPTIYRIDRIKELKVMREKFHVPYSSRFQEGEFRKRVQFMYGGRLQKVKFRYSGENVESVLDRLPTAKILEEKEGSYVISAEVFGKGIDMWLRSQGDWVERLDT